MSWRKDGNGNSAFWNLTNTVLIAACLIFAGIFGYLALSSRANAAEISTLKARSEVNAALINILSEDIPEMRKQLGGIDRRLYRLEAHFDTLPKDTKK